MSPGGLKWLYAAWSASQCARVTKGLAAICAAVHAWVHEALEVVPAGCGDASAQRELVALRELYTEHGVPDEMLALFNNGLGKLSHVVASSDAAVAAASRPYWVGQLTRWFVAHLARVDASPTFSRFFSFRASTDRMLSLIHI